MSNFNKIENNATFIVGHSRSGTTLLRNMFDGHPELLVFPTETHLFKWVSSPNRIAGFLRNTSFKNICEKYLTVNYRDIENGLKTALASEEKPRDVLTNLMEWYYSFGLHGCGEEKRWIEKTPDHVLYLNILKKWYGDKLKIVYIYRDPRDVYNSIKKKYKDLSLVKFIAGYRLVYREIKKYHDENWICKVKFETLVSDPENTMKHLSDFLGIKYQKSMLDQTYNGIPFYGNSHFEKYIKISTNAVGRYKDNLSDHEVSMIEYLLSDVMKDCGYKTYDNISKYRWNSLCSNIVYWIKYIKYMFLNICI